MNNQYVLDWLLKAGGDPNIMAISDAPSGTVRKGPLHYAASRGDECLDVLFGLLECRDTEINLKNTDGKLKLLFRVMGHIGLQHTLVYIYPIIFDNLKQSHRETKHYKCHSCRIKSSLLFCFLFQVCHHYMSQLKLMVNPSQIALVK